MKALRLLVLLSVLLLGITQAFNVVSQPPAESKPVARVEGYEISDFELAQMYDTFEPEQRRQFGRALTPQEKAELERLVLEQLIRQRLARAEGRRLNITVSDSEAERFLRQDSYFNPNGKFDADRWAQLTTNSPAYERAIGQAKELSAGLRVMEQARNRATPSDEELRSYFESTMEQVALNSLLIEEFWFEDALELDAAAIREHYEELRARSVSASNVETELFIVPFPDGGIGEDVSEEALAESRSRADSVLFQIQGGISFESAARAFGGSQNGGRWSPGQTTGLFDQDRELGTLALQTAEGQVVGKSLRVAGGYAVIRVVSKTETAFPLLQDVSPAVIEDYKAKLARERARSRMEAVRQAYPDSFFTICTTWNLALVDTSQMSVKEPKEKDLEKWYESNRGEFAQLDPEGRGLVVPEMEVVYERVRAGVMQEEQIKKAREVSEKIAKAWRKGKRDKKQEEKARVWRDLKITPDEEFVDEIPAILADSAMNAPVGYAAVIAAGRGFAVFSVTDRDSVCPVPEEVSVVRAERLLAEEDRREREHRARALYESDPTRYLTERGYAFTYAEVVPQPDRVHEVSQEEIEEYYHDHAKEFGQPATVRLRHILIAIGPERDSLAARNLALEVMNAAQSGAEFDSLVRKYSDDTATKDRGGDTGVLTREQVPSGFEQFMGAAFTLPIGIVGGPIPSPYGYHVIKVVDRTEAKLQELIVVRSNIAGRIAVQKAVDIAIETAAQAARDFDTREELISWADERGHRVYSQRWRPGTRALGAATNTDVQEAFLSASEPGMLPAAYRVGNNYAAVYLDVLLEPEPATWEQAREQALRDVDLANRLASSMREGRAMQAELASGVSWTEASAPWGGGLTHVHYKRGGVFEGIGNLPELDRVLFGPDSDRLDLMDSIALETDDGALVAQLDERHSAGEGDFESSIDSLRTLAVERGLYEYFESLKKRYSVRIMRADLQTELPPPPPLLSAVESRRQDGP